MAKPKDSRSYLEWNNERGSSGERLNRIPNITTILSNGKRYYSTTDAELFFGNLYVDEVTSIQWSESQNAMPIYGYNSHCFDDIALGTRIVQGQFSINYTKANFLGTLQSDAGFAEIARRQYGKDYSEESYFSDYRKRLNLPKWDKGFDIVIGYGHHHTDVGKVAENSTSSYLVLDCCQITGSSQSVSYVGEPVQEVYSFIARDIKYAMATNEERNPSDNNDTNGDTSSDNQTGAEINITGEINLDKKYIVLRTDDNVSFTGTTTLSLTYPFKDKTLMAEQSLYNPEGKTEMVECELSDSFVSSLKSEISDNGLKKVSCQYSARFAYANDSGTSNITRKGKMALTVV